jgi:type IV secretion system protein VirB10
MPPRWQQEDPRLGLPQELSEDIRPIVAAKRGGMPTWLIIVGVAMLGIVLFLMLDARRRSLSGQEATPTATAGYALPAPVPPLTIPSAPPPEPPQQPQIVEAPAPPAPAPQPAPAPPTVVYMPPPAPAPIEAPAPPRVLGEPALVVDTGSRRQPTNTPAAGASAAATPGGSTSLINARVQAGTLANRATTVPQGTLIPAVLESALDSTRPGLARALVSRDVRGFDGSRILIPRGSRLIGEYASDVQRGQRRALVNWVQLLRPDGVTIAIGSPSADPLGRAGTAAKVNNHFLERFGGAILQSALDLGLVLAASEIGGGALVVVPGNLQNATQITQPQQQIPPTLTVRQGTSISVFVARDLDFTSVETKR